jgi:hypothetical protein
MRDGLPSLVRSEVIGLAPDASMKAAMFKLRNATASIPARA